MKPFPAKKNNSIIQIMLAVVIFVLCAYSYHPRFYDITTGSIQNRSVVLLAEGLIFLLSVVSIRRLDLSDITWAYLLSTVAISVIVFACDAIGLSTSISAVYAMLPPFLALLIGKNLLISEDILLKLLRIYVAASTIVGFLCIKTNIGSFMILDQYAVAGKNASGAMLGVSGLVSFFSALNTRQKTLWRWFDIAIFVLIFIELLTIRARLSTLSLAIISVAMLIKNARQLKTKYIFLLVAGIIIIASTFFDTIGQFVYDSFFQNKEGNITSNRTELNKAALAVICDSPFIGNLLGEYVIDEHSAVHNFLLKTISQYGVFLSLPWVIIYLKLLFSSLKGFRKNQVYDGIRFLSFVLILFLFCESIGEYTYPFGPGTISFIPFLLLGYGSNVSTYSKTYEELAIG